MTHHCVSCQTKGEGDTNFHPSPYPIILQPFCYDIDGFFDIDTNGVYVKDKFSLSWHFASIDILKGILTGLLKSKLKYASI